MSSEDVRSEALLSSDRGLGHFHRCVDSSSIRRMSADNLIDGRSQRSDPTTLRIVRGIAAGDDFDIEGYRIDGTYERYRDVPLIEGISRSAACE